MYNGLTKATMDRDLRGVSKYYADDYSGGVSTAPIDKKATLEAMKNHKGPFRTTKRKVLGVVANRNKATATTDVVSEGNLSGKDGVHHFEIRARCLDTWVHNAAGWQIRHSKVMRTWVTRDGKPYYINGQRPK